jgi:hypothetical protein
MTWMRGLGSVRCIDSDAGGRQCQRMEVEGMEFCLQHMPDSMLAEAEQVTGARRCRHGICHDIAEDGTSPAACPKHKPARLAKAHLAVIQGQAVDRAGQIIAEHAADLEHPDPMTDPYGELMAVTGELKAWKDILRAKVVKLENQLRYQGKTGEQTRAEVMLYSQALRDLSSVLLSIGRLNLDARLVGIRQQTLEMLDRALDLALEDSGVPLDRKAAARDTFRKHVKVVA